MKGRYAPLGVVAIAMAGIAGVMPLQAHAANLPAICATLQTELNTANAGDTITLTNPDLSNPGHDRPCKQSTDGITYPITLPSKSITLTGAQPSDGFDGEGTHQLVTGGDIGSTTISNLTFENGSSSSGAGGLDVNSSTGLNVTLSGDTFYGNTSTTYAGALNLTSDNGSSTDTVSLTHNTFGGTATGQGNSSSAIESPGAVIINVTGNAVVTDNTISGNRSPGGSDGPGEAGGISVVAFPPAGEAGGAITFSSNIVRSNVETAGPGIGGGASLEGQSLTIDGNTFQDNAIGPGTSDNGLSLGGGLQVFALAALNERVRTAVGAGTPGSVEQSANKFITNSVGAFTSTEDTSATLYFGGGGEYIQAPLTESTADTFTGNVVGAGDETASPAGGGLAIQGSTNGETPLTSTFVGRDLVATGNIVNGDGYGGGIYGGIGAGCQAACPTNVELYDSTVDANFASDGPGVSGGIATADTGTFDNDIVYGNTGAQPDRSRSIGSTAGAQLNYASANLTVQYTDSCSASATPYTGTGNICTDPLLVSPTTGNVHETSSSPTVNTGSNALVPSGLTHDYYGAARVQQGTVDQGAAELAAAATTPTPTPVLIPVPSTGAAGAGSSPAPLLLGFGGVLLVALGAAARGLRRRSNCIEEETR